MVVYNGIYVHVHSEFIVPSTTIVKFFADQSKVSFLPAG